MTYPATPGYQAHSSTSRTAAEQLHSINTMEGQILDRLSIVEVGWTADELHQHLETLWPNIQSGTVAARLRGLQLKGKVVKGAAERKTRTGRMANEWWLKETADCLGVKLAEAAPTPMTATEIELRRRVTTLELQRERLKWIRTAGLFGENGGIIGGVRELIIWDAEKGRSRYGTHLTILGNPARFTHYIDPKALGVPQGQESGKVDHGSE